MQTCVSIELPTETNFRDIVQATVHLVEASKTRPKPDPRLFRSTSLVCRYRAYHRLTVQTGTSKASPAKRGEKPVLVIKACLLSCKLIVVRHSSRS